jgi:hypothetical protein
VVAPPPQAPQWGAVASYRGDYKPGGPAAGWTYAWSAAGRLGDAASYAPLAWSDSAGVYNTTGAATQVYDGKAHNDDYLMLTPDGGHPGRGKYYTIAGYTIQPEDGDGLYRLVSTSLMKSDGVKSKGEDGLDLQVFLNNARLGAAQSVGVDGSIVSFNRDLGQLAVGDTLYVMVGSAKNQNYDLFKGFNFTIEKLMPAALAPLAAIQAVPEPAAGLMAAVGAAWASAALGRRRVRPRLA